METILLVWLAWALFLWYLIRPATAFRALMAAGLVVGWSTVALADPAAGGGTTGDPLGDLQKTLTVAITGAALAVLSALGHRAWSWIGHSSTAQKLKADAEKAGLVKLLAEGAMTYVDQMEHVAGAALADSEIEKHVRKYLADHGVAAQLVDLVRTEIESRLGARRAAAAATNRLANAAQNLQEAMATGQLSRDLATLQAQQDAAVARMKAGDAERLPPPPTPGKAA